MKVHLKSINAEGIYRKVTSGKVRLSKIPQGYRLEHVAIYTLALRADCAYSEKEYTEDLAIMRDDIDAAGWSQDDIREDYVKMKAYLENRDVSENWFFLGER